MLRSMPASVLPQLLSRRTSNLRCELFCALDIDAKCEEVGEAIEGTVILMQ